MKLYVCRNFENRKDSRRLLKKALADYIRNESLSEKGKDSSIRGDNPMEIEVLEATTGKPYISYPGVYFNVSHSGDYWICGIGSSPLGVDIEIITDKAHKKLIERYFSSEEKAYIVNGNAAWEMEVVKDSKFIRETDFENNSIEKFYEIWTFKEAYSKLLGESIFKNLNFSAIEMGKLKRMEKTKDIYFKQCNEFKNAKCTLAQSGEDITLEIREISGEGEE